MKRAFQQSIQRRGARNRGGAIIIIAMVALLLASAIATGLVKLALAERRLVLREQYRLQSTWLAESGAERAAARLAKDADYSGETWKLRAADLGGSRDASVLIEVSRVESQPNRRKVAIVADFPAAGHERSRIRKVLNIDVSVVAKPQTASRKPD